MLEAQNLALIKKVGLEKFHRFAKKGWEAGLEAGVGVCCKDCGCWLKGQGFTREVTADSVCKPSSPS